MSADCSPLPPGEIMHYIRKAEELLLVSLFLVAVAVLTAQILSRYVMPYPLAWSEELARFLFLSGPHTLDHNNGFSFADINLA